MNIEDEDMAILLSCTLPRYFEHIKDIRLYSKEDIITLAEVQTVLRTKVLTKFKDLRVDGSG